MKPKPCLPYVAPFAIYMLFVAVQSPRNLVWAYPATIIAVAVALWVFQKQYDELRSPMWSTVVRRGSPDPATMNDGKVSMSAAGDLRHAEVRGQETGAQQNEGLPNSTTARGACVLQDWAHAILVGLLAITIWIAIDPYYPKLGKTEIFDPSGNWAFIGFRVVGAVIVVPLMEELFWRAFLIRWLVNEDFKSVPVGRFSWPSFAITVALFGGEHREWLAGLICGAMYNGLLYKRKDVFSCVVAHAVSNAALAAWVLTNGDWKFW